MYLLTDSSDAFLSAVEHEGSVVYTKKNRNGITIRCDKDDADVDQVYSSSCDTFYPVETTKVTPYDGIDDVPEKHRYNAAVQTERVVEVDGTEELFTVYTAEDLFFAMNRGEVTNFAMTTLGTEDEAESDIDPEVIVAFEERITAAKNSLKEKYPT